MSPNRNPENQLATLRTSFMEAFAQAPAQATAPVSNLLAIRVGGIDFALRIGELAGLVANKKIVPLPTAVSELLGIAGVRGALVPVYSLASLLNAAQDGAPNRWIALSSTAAVGLAFGHLDGYVQVSQSDIYAATQANVTHAHVQEVVRSGDKIRPVISMASLVAAIQQRCGPQRGNKEA